MPGNLEIKRSSGHCLEIVPVHQTGAGDIDRRCFPHCQELSQIRDQLVVPWAIGLIAVPNLANDRHGIGRCTHPIQRLLQVRTAILGVTVRLILRKAATRHPL